MVRKEVVVAAMATGMAACAGIAVYQYYWKKEVRHAVRTPVEVETEKKELETDDVGEVAPVKESDLVKALQSAVDGITEGATVDRKREVSLLRMLRGFKNITESSVETRLLVAQYCTGMFSTRMISPANQGMDMKALENLRAQLQQTYLVSAWEILRHELPEALVGEKKSRWFSLKLDVACRLHDSEKMNGAYEEARREISDQHQDKLVLLASASLVGRWDEVRKLGEDLAPSGELDLLHAASLKDPSMVDYSSLFLLAAHIAGPTGDDTALAGMNHHQWKAFEVKSARFRLPLGSSGVPLRPDLVPGSWTPQPPFLGVPLMRTGAIAHMVNPGAVPLPLSGFAGEDDMCLLGYFDVEQGGDHLRFTEFFTLRQDRHRANYWVGKELATMVCVAGPKAGEKITEAMLDVEFELAEDQSSVWKAV